MANQQTPDRVSSEPVPVPPPTDDVDRDQDRDPAEDVTDRVPGDTLDDRGTFDDPVLAGERNDPDDLTAVSPGAPEYHDPAPQNTAFGAATVGGAAAAAAQAGPSREVRDRDGVEEGVIDDGDPDIVLDDRHADHNGHDVRDDFDTNRDTDLDADRATAFDGDRVTADDSDRTAAFEEDRTAFEDERTAAFDADREAEERAYEDTADRGHLSADAEAGDDFRRDEEFGGPSDLPEATPATEIPAEVPATAAVEEPIAGLWGEGTAQGYRDRWREVQLRFVDDPPAAAREANQLVEEAVGALTAELSRQKEQLSGWSGEDTEDLRAVVRRHRDFLDRLLGL
ncbi:hypothetical protein [Phytohabitans houttuyneae]|nr:hypothetical protein [Phytohabitans houttuyneae]